MIQPPWKKFARLFFFKSKAYTKHLTSHSDPRHLHKKKKKEIYIYISHKIIIIHLFIAEILVIDTNGLNVNFWLINCAIPKK